MSRMTKKQVTEMVRSDTEWEFITCDMETGVFVDQLTYKDRVWRRIKLFTIINFADARYRGKEPQTGYGHDHIFEFDPIGETYGMEVRPTTIIEEIWRKSQEETA